VGAPSGQEGAANRGSADETGLAGAHVDAVLELEEAGYPVGVDIVGNGRATKLDGFAEDGLECSPKPFEAGAGEASSHVGGADAGVEEALVGIDVANTMQELLVEEGGLDRELAATEESGEIFGGDGEWLVTGPAEGVFCAGLVKSQTAETPGIDESELAARAERKNGVGVGRNGHVGGGDEQAAGHAEMDDPLSGRLLTTQVEDNMLADTIDPLDARAGKGFRHWLRPRLEGLLVTA